MNHLLDNPAAGMIFDLDGTLLDTEPLYTEATQKLLAPYGHTFTLELKKRCMGRDSKISAQIVIDEFGLPMTIDEYISGREVYLIELFETSPDITGAAEFINTLAQCSVPIGLATSSHKHLCDIKLSKKIWKRDFQAIICGDNEAVIEGKPAPDIFLACAKQIQVAADNCIAFEDSPTGIAAARSAGMKVVAINSPYVELEDLQHAEIIVDDYQELQPYIDVWNRQ